MRLLIAAVAVLLLAADPVIVLQPDGTAWFDAGDGSPTVLVSRIIRPPGTPPQPPDDPDDPQPPSPFRDQVKEWAEEINDPAGAQAFSKLFQTLADQLEAGTLQPNSNAIDAAISAAAALVIAGIDETHRDQWRAFYRDKLLPTISGMLIKAGGTLPKEVWLSIFRDIEEGLSGG